MKFLGLLKLFIVYLILAIAWETFQVYMDMQFTSIFESIVIFVISFILVLPEKDNSK